MKNLTYLIIAICVSFKFNVSGKNKLYITKHRSEEIGHLDSVFVNVIDLPKHAIELYTIDDFGNIFELKNGIQKLKIPCIIYDSNHNWYNLIKNTETSFTESNSKNWIVKVVNDDKYLKYLNFHIAFKKALIDKLSSENRSEVNTFTSNFYIKNFLEREKKITKDKEKRIMFLDEYALKNELPEKEKITLKNILLYEISALDYYGLWSNLNKFPVEYIKSKTKIGLNEIEDLLYNINYQRFLYLKSKIFIELETNTKKHKLSLDYEIISKMFAGKNRDFLLTKIINEKETYENTTDIEFNSTIEKYMKECMTSEYKEYIKQSQSLNSLSFKNNELIDINNQIQKFEEINKNKLSYIDFWASWCGPCRAEMPYSKKLVDEYTKKGINFIFLSIDKNPAAWEKVSSQLGLINSYLIPNITNSEIYKTLKITSIPRYIILNSKGEVINFNAPRPSDPKIKQLFDKLLQEK